MSDAKTTWNGVKQPPDEHEEPICFYTRKYRILQQGLELLLERIKRLNQQAKAFELSAVPYEEEVDDITRMIQCGHDFLGRNPHLVEEKSSIRSIRYLKAGLLLLISTEENKKDDHLPKRMQRALEEKIERLKALSEERWFKCLKPADVLFEIVEAKEASHVATDKTNGEVTETAMAATGLRPLPSKPILIFYCYSHADKKLREQLETHLSALRRQNLTVEWHDRKIGAGKEWEGQIDTKLDVADIVLLLVSATFIHSDYCYDVEMERALARHETGTCRVIPIILRDCDWQKTQIGKLEALPSKGKAVTGRGWKNTDEAFADIASGIRKVVEEIAEHRKSGPPFLKRPSV